MRIKKVVFFGGGMMAEAIIAGALKAKVLNASMITAIDTNKERCSFLNDHYGINATTDAKKALENADCVVLAIKPQIFDIVFDEKIDQIFPKDILIVSIIAGKSISTISKTLPKRKIIRVMPNTPLTVNEGMTVLSRGDGVDDESYAYIENIFSSCGQVLTLPENQLNAVTALSGSGPGYIFVVIDALADAGVSLGLTRDVAIKLAAQTVCGSGRMILETNTHPAVLRDKVTSPGGTTIAGIIAMEKSSVRSALIDAVKASYQRSCELDKNDK